MSDIIYQRAPRAQQKTSVQQWIVIGAIVIGFIVAWIIIWIVLVNNLRSTSSSSTGPTPGCEPSPPPLNLIASQTNFSVPNVRLQWDPVLLAATPGETVLGYKVYSRETPNITNTNTPAIQTSTFVVNLTKSGSGDMTSGTTVFFRVSTVDTCREGALGPEISFTPTQI